MKTLEDSINIYKGFYKFLGFFWPNWGFLIILEGPINLQSRFFLVQLDFLEELRMFSDGFEYFENYLWRVCHLTFITYVNGNLCNKKSPYFFGAAKHLNQKRSVTLIDSLNGLLKYATSSIITCHSPSHIPRISHTFLLDLTFFSFYLLSFSCKQTTTEPRQHLQ